MRIGLNLLYLLPGVVGGTESYAAGLIGGLARIDHEDEFIVFLNREAEGWSLPLASNLIRVVCPVRAVSRIGRHCYEQLHLPRLLKRWRVDVVHSLGYVAALWARCPSVVTVHDANFRALAGQMSWPRRTALDLLVRGSLRRAQGVITVSEFARSQLLPLLPGGEDRVSVIHEAPRPRARNDSPHIRESTLARLRVQRPYLLAFNSPFPHKNIARLLDSFELARREHGLKHRLVLIGRGALEPERLMPSTLADAVIQTGYLPDADVGTLFSAADALVFPSLYEGFGLPVLEAMQYGVPVACSRAASLPEVAGEAALYFDPCSVEEMAAAMERLANCPDLRAELVRKGFGNLDRFSWDGAARASLAIYRRVAAI